MIRQLDFYPKQHDTVLDWGLNPGPSALEASTIPLGYREGGLNNTVITIYLNL